MRTPVQAGIFLLLLFGCAWSGQNIPRAKAEIVEFSRFGDSLSIVSTDPELFFPFGKFSDTLPVSLMKRFEYKRIQGIIGNDSSNKAEVLVLTSDSQSATLLLEEDNLYHLASLDIAAKGASVHSKYFVGMKLDSFLKLLFEKHAFEKQAFRVVTIETGLTESKIDYVFEKGFLKRIRGSSIYRINF